MRTQGAAEVGRAAAAALAEWVAAHRGGTSETFLTGLCDAVVRLAAAKPSMAPPRHIGYRSLRLAARLADEGQPVDRIRDAVAEWVRGHGERSRVALDRIAATGAGLLEQGPVVVHSYSETVLRILEVAAGRRGRLRVIATESRPLCEGRQMAERVAAAGHDVTLILDAAMATYLRGARAALVGADAIGAAGFVGKTGVLALAVCAAAEQVPYYVAAETSKVLPPPPADRGSATAPPHLPDLSTVSLEESPAEAILGEWMPPPGSTVGRAIFEEVPARYVTGYVTERGLMPPEEIGALMGA